ncbi:hypothetical protein [Streptomyces collinus]|uniref:SLAC1 family transporter n=1 Tax=Streptomyces collinus TaxID=42684 RepID=UPI003981919C
MPGTSGLRVWWAERPPAAGAAVMATGIVSVALHLTGDETLSLVFLWLGCPAWLALAGAKLFAADSARLYLWNDDDEGVLRDMTGALLVLCLAWYVVLLVAEVVRPGPDHDVRRWATVFPLGMTAAAVLSGATALDAPWLRGPGRVLMWVAVAAWLAVSVGAVLDAWAGIRARR